MAYYSLEIDGVESPGERSWQSRWNYLADAVSLEGRRILELGCNQGLLSTWALKEGGAAAALGVDVDPEIVSSATHVARAFDVAPEFRVVDLDSSGSWEKDLLAFDADVVFALNVLRWVKDRNDSFGFWVGSPTWSSKGTTKPQSRSSSSWKRDSPGSNWSRSASGARQY